MSTFTREHITTGYGIVPNGLWTLNVSMGARVLLGWLHSHNDEFLATLTINKCRRMLGTSSVKKYMEELEPLGFVDITRRGIGSKWSFHLRAKAWLSLSERNPDPAPQTAPTSDRYRAEVGAPVSARVEEPLIEQPDLEGLANARVSESDGFDKFWQAYLDAWGSRLAGSKGAASRAWKKLRKNEKLEAIEAVERHHTRQTSEHAVPNASTWLNDHRFMDDELKLRPSNRTGRTQHNPYLYNEEPT